MADAVFLRRIELRHRQAKLRQQEDGIVAKAVFALGNRRNAAGDFAADDRFRALVEEGVITPAISPARRRPGPRVVPEGSVSGLVAEQRR